MTKINFKFLNENLLPSIAQYCNFLEYCPAWENPGFPTWVFPGSQYFANLDMKYQPATINRSWDSTLDKNLNLVYRRMDVCMYGQPECFMPRGPRAQGA